MDYHAALCVSGLGGVVRVGASADKGRGLFAAAPVAAGAAVFAEAPLCAMQHSRNAALVRACAECCRVIGRVEDQLEALASVRPSRELAAIVPEGAAAARGAALARAFPPLPRGFALPLFASADEADIAPVVPCAAGCGAEYCSAACRDDAARRYHVLLCPALGAAGAARGGAGADEDVNAAALFERQALATNEIFCAGDLARARAHARPESSTSPPSPRPPFRLPLSSARGEAHRSRARDVGTQRAPARRRHAPAHGAALGAVADAL